MIFSTSPASVTRRDTPPEVPTQSPTLVMQADAGEMRRFLKNGQPKQALQAASRMLMNLRNDSNYTVYAPLYNLAAEELMFFNTAVQSMSKKGLCSYAELFLEAQSIGFIIPRAYLMITIGALLLREVHGEVSSPSGPIYWGHAVYQELLTVCNGVLCPVRGLYVRHLLAVATLHRLPGEKSANTSVSDAEKTQSLARRSAFLLLDNFSASLKLLERLHALRSAIARSKGISPSFKNECTIQQEKKEFEQFLGVNLRRLNLENLRRKDYCEAILPSIVTSMIESTVPSVQHFILLTLLRYFPADFHLYSLGQLIRSITQLSSQLDHRVAFRRVMDIVSTCIEDSNSSSHPSSAMCLTLNSSRSASPTLSSAGSMGSIPPPVPIREPVDQEVANEAFNVILRELENTMAIPVTSSEVSAVSSAQPPRPEPKEVTTSEKPRSCSLCFFELAESLLNFSFGFEDGEEDEGRRRALQVLHLVARRVKGPPECRTIGHSVAIILSLVASHCRDLEAFVFMDGVLEMIQNLPHNERQEMTILMCRRAARLHAKEIHPFHTANGVRHFFELCRDTFLLSQEGSASRAGSAPSMPNKVEMEMKAISRLASSIDHSDAMVAAEMVCAASEVVGPSHPNVMPLLATRLVDFLKKLLTNERNGAGEMPTDALAHFQKIFEYLHNGNEEGILEVISLQNPHKACQLYVRCGDLANEARLTDLVEMCFAEALQLLDSCGGEQHQTGLLLSIVETLLRVESLSEEQYIVFATASTRQCSLLVSKENQCRTLAACAALYQRSHLSPSAQEKGQQCLERAKKVAGLAPPSARSAILVEFLSKVLEYFSANVPYVTVASVSQLIQEIQLLKGLSGRTAQTYQDPMTTEVTLNDKEPVDFLDAIVQPLKVKAESDSRYAELVAALRE